MQCRRTATLLAAVLLVLGVAAAQSPDDSGVMKGANWEELEQRETPVAATEQGLLDRVLEPLSTFSVSDPVVHPGESLDVQHTLSARDDVDYVAEPEDTIIAVETYLCADTGCDDPLEDQLVDDLSWRTSPDAIGEFGGGGILGYYHGTAELHVPQTEYTLKEPTAGGDFRTSQSPVEEGTYATVIYVVDTANNAVISEVWTDANQNEDWRATWQVEIPSPELVETAPPEVTVEDGTVTGTVHLENTGGSMQELWAVEMQVQPAGQGPLSGPFIAGQDLCDPTHPENVHKTFLLNADESASITLETDAVEPGQRYDVFFVTGTGCADDGGERKPPYGSVTQADTVCVGSCETPPADRSSLLLLIGGIILLVAGVYIVVW